LQNHCTTGIFKHFCYNLGFCEPIFDSFVLFCCLIHVYTVQVSRSFLCRDIRTEGRKNTFFDNSPKNRLIFSNEERGIREEVITTFCTATFGLSNSMISSFLLFSFSDRLTTQIEQNGHRNLQETRSIPLTSRRFRTGLKQNRPEIYTEDGRSFPAGINPYRKR
jgi:hypothetical protein